MHILCLINFFSKTMSFMRNAEKYGTPGQATDNNTIRHVCFACWITKATDTLRLCNTYCFSMAALIM
jgi:hypothetical protein